MCTIGIDRMKLLDEHRYKIKYMKTQQYKNIEL